MTHNPSPHSSLSHEQAWEITLNQLQLQMTRGTYDTHLQGTYPRSTNNGTWQVVVKSDYAREWLENRLLDTIIKTLTGVVGYPIDLEFVSSATIDQPTADNYLTCMSDNSTGNDPIAREVANPNLLLTAYLDPGGSGYAQVPHLYTRYWMPLLGSAYDLWLSLTGDDRRSLRAIAPDFWTPARTYSYKQLAARLNQKNPRCIYGYADECHLSRQRRLAEKQPLTTPSDCCQNAKWPYVRHRPLPNGGYLCEHWVPGRLETLHHHGLAQVQLTSPTSRKPAIQLWRLLPPLTPYQVKTFLTPDLQTDYKRFISEHGHLFRLDQERWQRITVPSLLPLMPEYQPPGNNSFEQRQARQAFLAAAVKNPNYLTCMSDNSGITPF